MRRLVTLGACSLAGAMALAACGDDDVVPGGTSGSGNAGRAGMSGAGGGSAGAGMGGNGGGGAGTPTGGAAGVPGGGNAGVPNAGNGGNAGDPGDGGVGGPPCTGCVELRVPVEILGDAGAPVAITSLFQFQDLDADFTDAVITFRIRALTLNDNFFIQFFSQDQSFSFNATGGFHNLNAGNGFVNTTDFIELSYDLSAVAPAPTTPVLTDAGADAGTVTNPNDFDKSEIRQFGVQVGAGENFVGAATVTVLIDSITIAGDGGEFDDVLFTVDEEGFVLNEGAGSQEGEVIHHP